MEMDITGGLLIGILACSLSFVAGAAMDAAVNKLCRKIEGETMVSLQKTIESQKRLINLLEKPPTSEKENKHE